MKVYVVICHGIYDTNIVKVFASKQSAKDYVEIRDTENEDIWHSIEEMKLEA
jgi:hypothetical protein